MLSGQTGLHHEDMKILYKDKERDSKMFLDLCGVKDRSKLVLKEDPMAQEKRLLEKRKNAVIEKAMKSIADISLEVDRLAGQVKTEVFRRLLPSIESEILITGLLGVGVRDGD